MPVSEHPMQALTSYLPHGSFEHVVKYLHHYKVHLTVTKQRKTVLGDYRHAHAGKAHRISVNGNLNPYEFLVTLLHELAHLLVFIQHANRVEPHGKEWKNTYKELLHHFLQLEIFPADIEIALKKSIINPAATANGETELLQVLRKYNTTKKHGTITLENIEDGQLFITDGGRIFKKIGLRRKRFECIEVASGRHYSFSALTEVNVILPDNL